MNTLQWKTSLTKFINKEAFKFTCLHLRRLWHCVVAAIVMVGVSRQGPHGVSIGLIGITFCAAVLPSFINLLKHYRQVRGVFWTLSLIFIGYVCLCLNDMITTITYGSSARLSQLAWKYLFVILGVVEFYICGRPKRDLVNLWQSFLLEYLRKTNRRKWTTGLLSLVRFDALAFIYLHFSRLFFCFLVGHGLLYLCPNPSESVKIALKGAALSVAALPSFIHLAKHIFFKIDSNVSAALFFLFAAYIYSCFSGATELTTASSSTHLSYMACQLLFLTWGILEFYICRRSQRFQQEESRG